MKRGFDLLDDNDQSREVIKQTLNFMKFHLFKPAETAAEKNAPPTPTRFVAMIRSQGIQKAAQAFDEAKKARPDGVLFRENTVNAIGYQLLQEQKVKEAIEVFELNVAAYPQSANLYDSLADAYEADGNRELAVQYAEKALEMLPKDSTSPELLKETIRTSAAEKLKRLKGQ